MVVDVCKDNIEIRRARYGDKKTLVSLMKDSFRDELRLAQVSERSIRLHVDSAASSAYPPTSWVLRATHEIVECWVAVYGSRVIGSYSLTGKSPLIISSVAVRGEYRHQGIGRRLMEHAFQRARDLGREQAVLVVLSGNESAVSLYRSLGMKVYDQRRPFTKWISSVNEIEAKSPRISLRPLNRFHKGLWHEALANCVSPDALRFEAVYREEYVSGLILRWLEQMLPEGRSFRREIWLDNRPVGFICMRNMDNRSTIDILPPIYLPEAGPFVWDAVLSATASAARNGFSFVRLYLSGADPDWKDEAEAAGYVAEQPWFFMYKDL